MDQSKFAVSTYDKVANKYTEQYFNDLSDSPIIDKFLSLLPQRAKILDVGCGPGEFTGYIMKKEFDVEGIDLSGEMLKIAKAKVPDGKFKLMDMRKLDYPDSTFDGLLVAYSLIHIPSNEIPATLSGLSRVLKPGGKILILAQKGEPDKIVDEPLKPGEKIFINFFSKERLAKFLTNSGFDIELQEEVPIQDSESMSDTVICVIAKKP